jgi:hypothetical protein
MLDFMSKIVFILGFGAKSVVELFEDSVDIGEELRYGKPATVSLVGSKENILYSTVADSVPDP